MVRMTATTGRGNKMVGYFSQARWLRKSAHGLPSRDINPQQNTWWIGTAAESGGWNVKGSWVLRRAMTQGGSWSSLECFNWIIFPGHKTVRLWSSWWLGSLPCERRQCWEWRWYPGKQRGERQTGSRMNLGESLVAGILGGQLMRLFPWCPQTSIFSLFKESSSEFLSPAVQRAQSDTSIKMKFMEGLLCLI